MLPVIISGGPGAGKTTLLEALAKRGYPTFSEVPRMLIEQQMEVAVLLHPDVLEGLRP